MMSAPRELDPISTVAEVAEYLKLSTRTVERAIADGSLESLQAGSSRRITRDAVHAWLRRATVSSATRQGAHS